MLICASVLATGILLADPPVDRGISFQRDIRPLLSDRCFHCHGPDHQARKADLRLDQWESAKSVIDFRNLEDSELLRRVTTDDVELLMPPAEENKPLSVEEKKKIQEWIAAGAQWQKHWAYEMPTRMDEALKQSASSPSNSISVDSTEPNGWIDQLVDAKLEQQRLESSPPAERVVLLRRVCFDLTGLPPSESMLERWLGSQISFAQLVDELLCSPEFGERMAMYWLDLVRYADTVGYHGDQDHNISAYRDWVIEAFNSGMPFDQMTIEQLAGDLLPNPTTQQKIATGYNRLLQTTHEGGLQPKEYRAIYAADRVRNFSEVWMAASLGCAQCHDHKFDPYTARDFYALAAFFADIDDESHFKTGSNDLPTRRDPEIELPTPEQAKRIAECELRIKQLKQADEAKSKEGDASQAAFLTDELKSVQAELILLKKSVRRSMITVALKEPRTTRVLPRGNWLDESGEAIQPDIPEFLRNPGTSPVSPDNPSDLNKRLTRLDLAQWLVDPKNGVGLLTARIMVNRLWYLCFGSGLARQLDEFGNQGQIPTHPELLDGLAHYLVDNQWDLRSVLRLIVLSRVYQRSSIASVESLETDSRNQWLSHQQAFRLPAEMIRDNALAVSGLLINRIGGESSRPYQPKGYYKLLNFPERDYITDNDWRQWRRGVYMHWQRQFLHPMLRAFDATNREQCTAQRPRSNTPLAALVLLNDPTFVEAARALAEKALHHTQLQQNSDGAERIGENNRDLSRIAQVMLWATSSSATNDELRILQQLLDQSRARFQDDPRAARNYLEIGNKLVDSAIDVTELASWTEVCRAILNLAQTVTRY